MFWRHGNCATTRCTISSIGHAATKDRMGTWLVVQAPLAQSTDRGQHRRYSEVQPRQRPRELILTSQIVISRLFDGISHSATASATMVAHSAPDTALANDVHMPPDRFIELHHHCAEVEQAAAGIEIDQQIDVALLVRLSARDGAKTRTLNAPCLRAMARISWRFSRTMSDAVMSSSAISNQTSELPDSHLTATACSEHHKMTRRIPLRGRPGSLTRGTSRRCPPS